MKPATITALTQARALRQTVAFAKNLADGADFLLPDDAAPLALNQAARAALAAERTGTERIDGQDWFIEAITPPPRLILVGAVHIAQSLAPLAAMMGFDVTLVDPRRSFATPERFPGVILVTDWPDAALDQLAPDRRTAIVTLTHDPKLDDPALDRALRSDAFYIGALGSRKTHAARLDRLGALGHDDAALGRIHGPVGLDIAALTAPEIALSIVAEIIALRRSDSRHGAKPGVAALVLAAGTSSRMAPCNKLLKILPSGKPMIAQTVDHVLASAANPVIVVTGHQAGAIRAALAGRNVRFVHAADYAFGLSASLRDGILELPPRIGGALICLGDMPLVDPPTLDRIIAAYDPALGREIILPTHGARRGNPVLWGKRFFGPLGALSGDAGGRQILAGYAEFIFEIPVETDAVLRDFDTADALAGYAQAQA
jgi:xanthine dehydrogenase accessory factor